MPARSVAEEYGLRAWRHLGADLLKVFVHGLGVGVGHDHGGARGARGADGAEDVGRDVPVVANHRWARADRRPDVGVAALLAYAGFVLKPDFEGTAGGRLGQRGFDQAGEVFLKVASAAGSFCG